MKGIRQIFEPVDGSTPLGQLLNKCMEAANMIRIFSYPKDFKDEDADRKNLAITFYESCLVELYLHSVIDSLHGLKSVAKEYIDEFDCSWK